MQEKDDAQLNINQEAECDATNSVEAERDADTLNAESSAAKSLGAQANVAESVDMQANVTENVTAQHNFDKNLNSQNDATSQLKNAQNNAVSPLKAVYNSAQPLNNVNNTTESLGAQAERFVKSATVNFIMLVMAIFAGCFVFYTFFFQVLYRPIIVAGISMQPTINASVRGANGTINTDAVYYSRFDKSIDFKDIVIIDGSYSLSGYPIIKRVIATPGQTIIFRTTGELYANPDSQFGDEKKFKKVNIYILDAGAEDGSERLLDEPYTKNGTEVALNSQSEIERYSFYNTYNRAISNHNFLTEQGEFRYTLADDEFFVCGDNRNYSTDSRYFGPITGDHIVGKVKIHVKAGENLFTTLLKAIFN